MKLTFLTNFINHHQVPVADEFYKVLHDDYTLVSTVKIPENVRKSGYPDFSDKPYLLKAYESKENYEKAFKLAEESDVVILGTASHRFISERVRQNKLTFIYSERWFKEGYYYLFSPKMWKGLFNTHLKYRNKKVYVLCASAYTAFDMALVGAYKNKCIKWGYFPKIEDLDISKILQDKDDEITEILWVARFLEWKHPELAVKLAARLKRMEYRFHLTMVGGGKLFEQTEQLVRKMNVCDSVTLKGNVPNDEILELMKQKHLFIFTSDRNEGWGVVLNEAMSNGCTVIASNMIGAAPFLIKDGVNGFMFKDTNLQSLTEKVEVLINDKRLREQFALNGYNTVRGTWSPGNAARIFLDFSEKLLKGEFSPENAGPCSRADVFRSFKCL